MKTLLSLMLALIALPLAGCSNIRSTSAQDSAGDALPKPEPAFAGKIGRTVNESTPDFPKQEGAPKGAPNVLLILTDDVGFGASDQRQDLMREVHHGVFVREPVHGTSEHEVSGLGSCRERGKESGIDAGMNNVNGTCLRCWIEAPQRLPIDLGHGQHEIESRQRVAFEIRHPFPLHAEQMPGDGIASRLGVTAPDVRLDVVREQHRRTGQCLGQVD